MRVRAGALVFWLWSTGAMLAQTGAGTITGVVFEPSGAPFPAGVVRAKNAATSKVYEATSGPKGEYTLTGVAPGTYVLTVVVRGEQVHSQAGVMVGPAQPSHIDIHLQDPGQLGAIGDNFVANAALDRRPVPTGPTPRALDGKPDLSGVWAPTRVVDAGKPELLPAAAAIVKERFANNMKDIPTARCLPWGPTFDVPVTFKFVQAPTVIVILWEDVFSYRQIFLDGRGHSKDADPTWMGHSIGRWEGDTLVVDTAGFNDKSWTPVPYPHTEKLHMIERIRRPDLGHLEIETVIEDPGTYAKPWTFKRASQLLAGDEIGEYICAENNQDVGHMVGK